MAESDQGRSYAKFDRGDLERLGRVALADWNGLLRRQPHLEAWRDEPRVVALAQGGAEHYLRGKRGIRDIDVILCVVSNPALPRLSRRQVVTWDWGPSRFGRCPYDPPEYTGRAVDVKLWVIPEGDDPVASLVEWLANRRRRTPDPLRKLDLAQEPVVLISQDLGRVVWDPGGVPQPGVKTDAHRRPHGVAPP